LVSSAISIIIRIANNLCFTRAEERSKIVAFCSIVIGYLINASGMMEDLDFSFILDDEFDAV
jgi:hypothetical protein